MKFTLFGLSVEFACMNKGLESGLSNCNSGWPRCRFGRLRKRKTGR